MIKFKRSKLKLFYVKEPMKISSLNVKEIVAQTLKCNVCRSHNQEVVQFQIYYGPTEVEEFPRYT